MGSARAPGWTLCSFLPPEWSVAFRDGQYRAVWPGGPMGRVQSGNEGWSGREGQPPPGSSTMEKMLTPSGASVSPQPRGSGRHGFCRGGGGRESLRFLVGL